MRGQPNFNIPLSTLTNHNTSAFNAYNTNQNLSRFQTNFVGLPPTSSDIDTNFPVEDSIPVDASRTDRSLNSVSPGHVSNTDVHSLLPNFPNMRWFAHVVPWFTGKRQSHIDNGNDCSTFAYATNAVNDMINRGFNGLVVDWDGTNKIQNTFALNVQKYLAMPPPAPFNKPFKYIIMVDGSSTGLTTNNLTNQMNYLEKQYFLDSNYETEPTSQGVPILMFFSVASRIVGGNAALNYIKGVVTNTPGNKDMFWVEQGFEGQSWENGTFHWTDNFDRGSPPSSSDPFNLGTVTNSSPYNSAQTHNEPSFAAMCSQFNGTLTFSRGWSDGKYLPGSNGVCLVKRAAALNTFLRNFPVFTRMQWATWSDYEEGSEVELGIENYATNNVTLDSSGNLSNIVSSADPSTIHHYEIYASKDRVNAALVAAITNGSASFTTNLNALNLPSGQYFMYVDAVGIACVRDHLSTNNITFTMGFPEPTGFTAEATNGAVMLSWNQDQGATSYTIDYGTNVNNLSFTVSGITATSNTVTGLLNGTNYFFSIKAISNNVSSGFTSPPITATPLNTPVVTGVASSGRIDLSWAPIIGATGYTVSYTLNGVPTSVQTTLNSFWLEGLTDGTQLTFQVKANNANGQGANGSLSLTPQAFDPTQFNQSMQVSLTGYAGTSTLTNFPLLIELSTSISGFNYSQLQSGGTDLRFVDSSGNVLSYEIEQWNPTGTSTVWVRIPQLNSSTVITDYWGDSTLTTLAPWTTNGATWGGFLGVYHLQENGLPYADSSLANPLTSGTPPVQTSGLIDNAQIFTTTSSQFLTPGSINLGQTFSVSAWVNLSSAAANIQTIWGSKEAGGASAGMSLFVNTFNTSDGSLHMETGDGPNTSSALSGTGKVPVSGWHQVYSTVNEAAGTAEVYVDGTDVTVVNSNKVLTDFPDNNNIDLGAILPGNGNQFFLDGTLEEARLEPLRSADWVRASWMTVAQNSTLAVYGAVTPVVVNLTAPTVTAEATNGAVTLSWNSINGAAGYDILMSNNATGFNLLTTVGAATSVKVSLANGVLYFFEVAATNSAGNVGPDSVPVSAEPLDTPSGFTAFGTDGAVDLNWTGVTGANGYIVTYGPQGNEQTALAASGPSSTTVSGLTDGTEYFFLLKATNANGQGSNAGEPSATPIGTPSIQTVAAGDGSVTLSWTGAPGAAGYVVLYANGGPLTAQPASSTSATINNLTDGSQYSFIVEGTNANGTSTPSSQVTATPVATPVISSAFGTNAAVVLNWTTTAGASGYIISNGIVSGQESASVAVTQPPFTVGGLQQGQQYFFVVTATNNNNGQSPNSNETNATPIATPGNVTATALNASVSLTWGSSAGASGYWVLYGTTSGSYPNVLAVNSTTTSATVNNLKNGQQYFFIIEGTNATGVSAASGQVPATPSAQTLVPTDYSRTMKITFTGYNRPGPVVNFPVLVELSTSIPGFSYTNFTATNGNDLRFTDSSGNLLNHEIDQWNTNGVSTVWVSVPSIASSSDFINAYWGDRADSNTPAFSTNGATWPGFLAVLHLKENGFPYADSTTLNPATTGTAPAQTTSGEIGNAESFNGTSDFLALSNSVNLGSSFSLSAWVNLNVGETNIQTIWANKQSGGASNGIALFVNTFNTADGAVLLETGDGIIAPLTAISTAKAVRTNSWHHIFAAVNEAAGTAALYVDATNVTVLNSNKVLTDFANNTNMTLGSFTNNHWFLNGRIDEARIEPLRDSNWVWATVMTVASNSFFASNGPITLTKVLDQDLFNSSMKLTISGYTGSSTLSNFPLLVNLSTSIPGFSYSQFASSTGNDLRFTDASGQILLAHEIDTWNTSGTSSVWVSVPIIASNTNYIIAYWGNPNLTGVASFTTNGATWSNYLAVFHLRESTFPYVDSTTNHNANSGMAPTQTTSGEIGNAEAFNGSTTFLNAAGAINLGNAFSFSGWVNLSNSASNIQTLWANKGGGANSNGIAIFINSFNTADGQVHVESGDGVNPGARADSNPGTVTVGAWHHVFAAIDRAGGTATIYVDGKNVTSNAFDRVLTDFGNNAPFTLARYTNNNFSLKGMIDEARIEPIRNADWVQATYTNVIANANFISYPTASNPVRPPNMVIFPSQSPQLQIGLGANGLLLSWPSQTTTFMLYSSSNLMDWNPISNYTVLPDGQVQVPMSTAPGATFYRLQSQ